MMLITIPQAHEVMLRNAAIEDNLTSVPWSEKKSLAGVTADDLWVTADD